VSKPAVLNVSPFRRMKKEECVDLRSNYVIKQADCGCNDSNDGRNAAGKASVRRPCRHTAHARTHLVRKNRHHQPPCVRALRPSLLLSPKAIHLRALASNTLKNVPFFYTFLPLASSSETFNKLRKNGKAHKTKSTYICIKQTV